MSTSDRATGALQYGPEEGSPGICQQRESDTSLVMRMKTGDVGALSLIYDRYCPAVFAMLLDLLEDTLAAEDVLRDLFVQLWRRAEDFDSGSGSLPAWLMVIGHNLAMSRLRPSLNLDTGDDLETYPENGAPSPFEGEIQLRTVSEQLRMSLAEGSIEERKAMELAYFGGLTQSEIVLQTGGSRESVRNSLLKMISSLIETYGNAR